MKKIIVSICLAAGFVAGILCGVGRAHADSGYVGYNQTTVAKFVAVVNMEAARYGVGYVPVYVGPLDDDRTIAESDGYSITLNTTYANMTLEQWDAVENADIAAGYHPGGCNAAAATAIHELGHVIDRATGRVATAAVWTASSLGVMHGYAYTSAGEAVAVSFQAVECGTATAQERAINNVLMNSQYVS